LVDLQQTVYPHKWSPISYWASAAQGKFNGQGPTFYHCATWHQHPHRIHSSHSILTQH